MPSTPAPMDQFSQSLIADPPLKNPYFGLPDIANILTSRDQVAKIRASKKTPNTLIGLFGQADKMTDQESTEFVLQILQHGNQHSQGFTPDWKAVASALGVANGHHVKRRFEVILKSHGFSITRDGVISGRGNVVASAEAESDANAIADAAAARSTEKRPASTVAATSTTGPGAVATDDTAAEDDFAFLHPLDEDPNIDPSLLLLRDATAGLPEPISTNNLFANAAFSPYFSGPVLPTPNLIPPKPTPFSASSGFAGLSRGRDTPTQQLPVSPATAAAMSARGLSPPNRKGKAVRRKRDIGQLVDEDEGGNAGTAPAAKKKRGRKPKNAVVGVDPAGGSGDAAGTGTGTGASPEESIEFDG